MNSQIKQFPGAGHSAGPRKLAAAGLKTVLDSIYPPALYCSICGNLIDGSRTYHLCDNCVRHIRWDTDPPAVIPMHSKNIRLLRVCTYGVYERSLIFSLKYQDRRELAKDIAEMMRDRLEYEGLGKDSFDYIVPIPLSKEKEKTRGFNQTVLMGKYLAKMTGAELLPHALLRVKDTRPMRGLSPRERQENIEGAFAPGLTAWKLAGKRVLLIDDFATTLATGNEAVRMLLEASPSDITFMVFAARWDEAVRSAAAGSRNAFCHDGYIPEEK